MNVSVGADHGAFELREAVVRHLKNSGHSVNDHGVDSADSVDYPDYAALVAEDIQQGRAEFGVLLCTNGVGMSIAANKRKGVRAALINFEDDAEMCRRHNNANVICLAGRRASPEFAAKLLDIFLSAKFEDGGRHTRRVGKLEAGECGC